MTEEKKTGRSLIRISLIYKKEPWSKIMRKEEMRVKKCKKKSHQVGTFMRSRESLILAWWGVRDRSRFSGTLTNYRSCSHISTTKIREKKSQKSAKQERVEENARECIWNLFFFFFFLFLGKCRQTALHTEGSK